MTGDGESNDINRSSRAELRRLSREAHRRHERFRRERDSFLETQLEPGERIVARSRDHPIITDRRILLARQLTVAPRRGEWVCEAIHDYFRLDARRKDVQGFEAGPYMHFWNVWLDKR